MADRTTLLEGRVVRLTRLLDELREAWAYVHDANPDDALRLDPLSREIELTEIELETSQRALELHRTVVSEKASDADRSPPIVALV
jgi:hypothetical protein